MSLEDKIIIVTGAASGMGKATVFKLHELGSFVYACDLNADGLIEFKELERVVRIPLNISSSEQCDGLIKKVISEKEHLDGLVNFAGVIKRTGILECTDEEFDFVMKTNVYGCFYMVQATARAMIKQGSGSIVNISSIWSDIGARGVLAYCTSKGAVSQITRSAALDLAGTGVRVNEIRPGETNTPMLASERNAEFSPADVEKKLTEIAITIPEKRLAKPEEMADAAIFLLSDKSSYMQGASLTVDGGYSAQ